MPTDGTDNDVSYYTPFNLYRSYTSKHKWWYDSNATDAISSGSAPDATKIEANGGNIYVTYSLDSKWNTANAFYTYPTNGGTIHWYAVKFSTSNNNWFLKAETDISQSMADARNTNVAGNDYDSSHKEYYWALIGTPYNLKLVNMYHGDGYYLGMSKTATASAAKLFLLSDTEDNNVTWEMVDGMKQTNTYPYFRLQNHITGKIFLQSILYI